MIEPVRKGRFPHLVGAMAYEATNGVSGLCFHRASAFVLDTLGSQMCFGTLRAPDERQRRDEPRASLVPFIHAWVEVGETLYSPTTIEAMGGLYQMTPRDYYERNGVADIRRLPRREVLRISGEIGLSAHFRRKAPLKSNMPLGMVLLDAAGVDYTVNAQGSVLPAQEYTGPAWARRA